MILTLASLCHGRSNVSRCYCRILCWVAVELTHDRRRDGLGLFRQAILSRSTSSCAIVHLLIQPCTLVLGLLWIVLGTRLGFWSGDGDDDDDDDDDDCVWEVNMAFGWVTGWVR
ncbi:hypothetical protein L1987_45229 [Smallanthus sonchifolius]|uniref:Uncharacterized protein n=1 Tax=Smallanthus sonchifolius TaxID=185202 RepID=A0ACB9GTS9_9ASTR|nr:hypothetical protein L1987_45229 [Smallanthus sonchifolius]